jgi:hypothetical protein
MRREEYVAYECWMRNEATEGEIVINEVVKNCLSLACSNHIVTWNKLPYLIISVFLTLKYTETVTLFENRVLRRIFGPKRNEVTGGWRKLHNEELHNLYSSPSIIRMIKSRRMRWAGIVARMVEKKNAYRWGSQEERDH